MGEGFPSEVHFGSIVNNKRGLHLVCTPTSGFQTMGTGRGGVGTGCRQVGGRAFEAGRSWRGGPRKGPDKVGGVRCGNAHQCSSGRC